MYTGPKLTNDNLVFGYDTGYGIADNAVTTRFYQGEPTETFSIGSMLPTDPTASFVGNSTSQSNLAGSAWDWSYYPNSNISSDGGMEWRPEIQGPTFTGAWLMKKRAGGNGESNFSGTAPGSITSSAAYTVSVWVKTDQASCFRIHLNTTKNGSSYWGYASGYHSGGNEWERLSLTLPANSGNTAINVIRFQAVGSSVNADAYCRDYQVEKRGQATPFILGGTTRSNTASLIDLKKTNDIDVSNVSFDSTGQPTFDGTDDEINITFPTLNSDYGSIEVIVARKDTTTNSFIFGAVGASTNRYYLRHAGSTSYDACRGNPLANASFGVMTQDKFYHLVMTWDASTVYAYTNGVFSASSSYTNPGSDITGGNIGQGSGNHVNADLPVFKIHNKTLTAAEIKSNFNAYKNRFDIQ